MYSPLVIRGGELSGRSKAPNKWCGKCGCGWGINGPGWYGCRPPSRPHSEGWPGRPTKWCAIPEKENVYQVMNLLSFQD